MANRSSFRVEEGDILLLGTDGLFDNMHEDMIVDFISKYKVKTTGRARKWYYGKCSKNSNTLKLRTPKIIAENNF